ncbi:MAG: AAA family ATPase [Gaiellaceae bacterium]
MKLKKITIEGFRGAPKPFELLLDGMSLCLLGENGLGKTTIVDGLEYWSVGKLENFTREGYGLDATINLDHGPPATITCERQGHATLRRTLSSSKAEDLEVVGPTALDSSLPPALPILRHATMARFMANSPGDKKRALIGVLGLEELLDFRDTLVKVTGPRLSVHSL